MRTAVRELRYALRRLRGSPGFTIAATITMAVAIGATASVFGLVDGVLLKAFPYRDPDRVFTLWSSNPRVNLPKFTVSAPDYLDWRAQNTTFSGLAAAMYAAGTVTGKQEPEHVPGLAVTPNYFPVMGLTPIVGRGLSPDSGGPAEVVIGNGLSQRRFGGASSALGQTLMLDNRPYAIVGVLPSGLPGTTEVWTRLSFRAQDVAANSRDYHILGVFGRLKAGATQAGAQREMEAIANRLAREYLATNESWSVITVPLLDELIGDARPALVALLAAAACVLLIGSANLANLFLVRCLARQRELAVRSALGATRGRLLRELVAEAATLGVAAGALGVGVAIMGVRILRSLAPPTLPRLSEIGVDGRVVAFCALISVATVLVFGLLPAWHVSRGSLAAMLKEGGRGTGSAQHHRVQDSLVVLQVAVALVLLTGAGLLASSFAHFQRMDPGFRPRGVLTAQIDLSPTRYPTPESQNAFVSSALERLAALPGVRSASASSALPSFSNGISVFAIPGQPTRKLIDMPSAHFASVSPEYFKTMGIALRRGRTIQATDDSRAPKIVVVDETLVHRYLGDRQPLGQRLVFDTDTMEIVGVAPAIRLYGWAVEDAATLYFSIAQNPVPSVYLSLRTSDDPTASAAGLRRVIAGLDPSLAVSDVKTMDERVADTMGTTRFSTFLASLFAAVALVLGMIGIYSVLSYIVSQRRREIGVRLALGASHAHVMRDVVRRALALTGTGIAVGSVAAWFVTRGLSGLFVGVDAHDPAIFAGAAVVFAVVALVAALIPALRTTQINPVAALSTNG